MIYKNRGSKSFVDITNTEKQLLRYMFSALFNDLLNFSVVLFISFISGNMVNALLYIVTLSSLRRYSGGWHASTKILCFVSYQAVFILMTILSRIDWSLRVLDFLFCLSATYCLFNAPIEHIHNPLSEEERNLNKIKLKRNYFIIALIYLMMHIRPYDPAIFVVCFAAVWNMICMVMLKHSPMWRKI